MIPVLRQDQIIEILQDGSTERIRDLAEKIGTSDSTIRRDLKELVAKGEIEVLRGGGVRILKNIPERGIFEKILLNRKEKERIAKYAAKLVRENDVIFLDPSSTNCILIEYIQPEATNVKFITNSIEVSRILTERGMIATLIGGDIKITTSSCVGASAQKMMQDFRFTKCFIGANGMSVQMGLTSHDSREWAIKQLAIANSQASYFLVDSSKYNHVAMHKISEIDECMVITGNYFNDFQGFDNIVVV